MKQAIAQLAACWSRVEFFFTRNVLWRLRKPRFIVLMGGPGAGKGTLAAQLAPSLGIAHLSTGDAFRRELATQSDFAKQVESYIKAGKLVPDHLTIQVVRRELQQRRFRRGAVLDGFPRTLEQAQMLDALLTGWGASVERVVLLEVDEPVLIERLSLRRTCSNKSCGRSYHLKYEPPKEAGICDVCKSPLYQRSDDVPEAISERLVTYRRESKPLCDYYQGNLVSVRSTQGTTKEEVFALVKAALLG